MANSRFFAKSLNFLIVLLFSYILHKAESATQTLPATNSGQSANSGPRFKGELGEVPIMRTTPATTHPIDTPKWDSPVLKSGISTNNKGDLGIMDPRGTVRYNIMSDGRIARGIITSLQDEDSIVTQAEVKPYASSYDPIETQVEDEDW